MSTKKKPKAKRPRSPAGSGPRCCLCNQSIRKGRMCRTCKVGRLIADTPADEAAIVRVSRIPLYALRASARLPLFTPHVEESHKPSTPANPKRGRGAA